MTMTMTRRQSFRPGTRVQRHPDTNPGLDNRAYNDRGTVQSCEPAENMAHLDLVAVLWDSVLANLTERQLDQPVSAHVEQMASTRLRRAAQ